MGSVGGGEHVAGEYHLAQAARLDRGHRLGHRLLPARPRQAALAPPQRAPGPVSAGSAAGQPEGGVSPGSVTVVSQARPRPSRPRITRGTIRTEPSDDASKVKVPNATGPEPRTRTRSSTSAASNTERSHFSPAVNLSSPAGSVTLTASPQPARPAP